MTQLALTGFAYQAYPVTFWDPFGTMGHPVHATISDMEPLLLGRMLNLNDTQAGLLELDSQGGEKIFGEPMLNIADRIQTDSAGRGMVNILCADQLMQSPKTYATLLLWLLSELFENLPEAGDLDKPKLVFFFDEAHLLFNDAPQALVDKIEQMVRLIRSRGVGVYFVTQNPADVPDKVLSQLGNRVQHAPLRQNSCRVNRIRPWGGDKGWKWQGTQRSSKVEQ